MKTSLHNDIGDSSKSRMTCISLMIRSWLVLSSHPRVNYSGERGAAMWGLCIVAEMLLNGASYTKMICGGALCKMICFGFDDSWNAVVVFKTHVSTSLPGSTC